MSDLSEMEQALKGLRQQHQRMVGILQNLNHWDPASSHKDSRKRLQARIAQAEKEKRQIEDRIWHLEKEIDRLKNPSFLQRLFPPKRGRAFSVSQ
jgi:uncharacterized coiled-coil DUF342 family protein